MAASGFALWGLRTDVPAATPRSVRPRIRLKTAAGAQSSSSAPGTGIQHYQDTAYYVTRHCDLYALWHLRKKSTDDWLEAGVTGVAEGDCSEQWYVRLEGYMKYFEKVSEDAEGETIAYDESIWVEEGAYKKHLGAYILNTKWVNDSWVLSATNDSPGAGEFGSYMAKDDDWWFGILAALGFSTNKSGNDTAQLTMFGKVSAEIHSGSLTSFEHCGIDESGQPSFVWTGGYSKGKLEIPLGSLVFEICNC